MHIEQVANLMCPIIYTARHLYVSEFTDGQCFYMVKLRLTGATMLRSKLSVLEVAFKQCEHIFVENNNKSKISSLSFSIARRYFIILLTHDLILGEPDVHERLRH